ncbi:hypothetical protein Pmani_020026 [Petrolisthes manimaculis]|uniref:Uncharacterized protein n=1 Tax=Petrolisthes manimaculis TaxID=1843537 RepID=A0AAE1PHS1_9EUCA|nr:hypothetical protein Pmani_020026 [Petrolisthes manimaculis]
MGPGCLLWLLTFTSELWKSAGLAENTEDLITIQTRAKEFLSHSKVSVTGEEGHQLDGQPGRLGSESRIRQMRLKTPERLANAMSLVGLLKTVIHEDLSNCHLVFVYDASDLYSIVVQELMLLLLNSRQVFEMKKADDLLDVLWVSTGCGGYLLLLDHTQPLLTFANTHHHTWDYHGRYVFVSQRVEQVEALVATRNGKKTEHILGVVKGGQEGEWRVYMNMLYWGEGVRPVTTWRHHRFTSHSQLFPDKLTDLQGAVLKVSTFELAPSVMYYRDENESLLYRYGEDIAVTETLARVLNFSLKFAEPADGYMWGWKEDDNWMGLLGELYRDEADIGLCNLFITINRVEALDYSAPFSDDGSCFMARVEPPLPRWQALAFPFHPWTWLAILVGVILSGPILFLMAAASGYCRNEKSSLAQLGFSWFYSFGLHFREPQATGPCMDPTRVFVLFLWFYTMILTIAYSTNLTAFLLVQKPPHSIQTIEEIHQSDLEVAGLGAMLKDGNINLANLYKSYETKEEAFTGVMEGKAVFWINGGFLRFHIVTHFTVRGVARARIMRECFMPYNIGMGLQRHSPLKRKFDEVIGWIQQSGILKQAVTQALRLAATTKEYGGGSGGDGGGETVQEVTEEGAVVALNVDHMQGVFMIAALGWFIAVVLFLLEIFALISYMFPGN